MKIKISQLRSIIKEEIQRKFLLEQTPEQITRLRQELEKIMSKDENREHVFKALQHIATPDAKDDTREDYMALGHAFADLMHTDDQNSLSNLMKIFKQMTKEKKPAL